MAVERNLVNEFFERVAQGPLNGCWSWAGTISAGGYGKIHLRPRTILAHRFSYEIFKGGIPEGLFICHHCDNPRCVNPDHLYAGTPKQNSADRDRRGRANIAHGERHYKATLTDEEVVAVRESSRAISDLAEEFGVSRSMICTIQLGRVRMSAGGPIRDRIDTHRKTDTHCANGHELNENTVYVYPKTGKTYCRACGAKSARKRKAKAREAKAAQELA